MSASPNIDLAWFEGAKPCNLRELSLPADLRLLVLAPHPDDFDAVGLTLKWLFGRGHPLHVAVADTSSGIQDSYRGGLTSQQKTVLRRDEQRASARFFGLDDNALIFLALKNGETDQVSDHADNLVTIEELIRRHRPDLIFLPHGNDSNSAHRAMYSLASRAVLNSGRTAALMLNRDAKTGEMKTDLYFPFGPDEAAWKAELLRFHDSQQQRNLNQRGHGFDQRVLTLNREIALELKLETPYAESFELELIEPGKRLMLPRAIG